MDRREFLISTGGAAVAASATATTAAEAYATAAPGVVAPAVASGVRTLRLAMPWPDNGRGYGDSARRLSRRLEAMTDGRFRVELKTGTAMDGASAELYHGSAHDYAAHHRAMSYFAGLPGPNALSMADFSAWLMVGGGQMLWDDLAIGAGVKPLLAGHTGANPPLWSTRPIQGLGDLAGRKVFAAGLGADVARALGAEPAPIAAHGEISASFANGAIDVVEWGGQLASLAAGLPTRAGHATGHGFNRAGTALALNVRLDVWHALSPAERANFSAAALEEFHVSVAEARAHEAIAARTIAALGVTTSPFPADVAEAIGRVSDAVIAHVAGIDETASRIDQSYMAFRNAITARGPLVA